MLPYFLHMTNAVEVTKSVYTLSITAHSPLLAVAAA